VVADNDPNNDPGSDPGSDPGNGLGNDTIDRALRLLVYGPVGFACYMRDNASTFIEVFAQRGKREVGNARRAVEDLLGRPTTDSTSTSASASRAPSGTSEPRPSGPPPTTAATNSPASPAGGAPARRSAGARVRPAGTAPPAGAPRPDGPSAGPSTATSGTPAASSTSTSGTPAASSTSTSGTPAAPTGGAAPTVPAAELPIPGYDLLSASQVIERLEGLSRGALERIREHELTHRARRTILASIDHLTG
jgi:hypothetical protein